VSPSSSHSTLKSLAEHILEAWKTSLIPHRRSLKQGKLPLNTSNPFRHEMRNPLSAIVQCADVSGYAVKHSSDGY
jgi:hypothetical protein